MASKAKIKSYFNSCPEEVKNFADKLVDRLFFQEKTLKELEKDIKERGIKFMAKNGNGFDVILENPSVKSYNAMVKIYNATIKQLVEMLPKTEAKETDEFMEFIKK